MLFFAIDRPNLRPLNGLAQSGRRLAAATAALLALGAGTPATHAAGVDPSAISTQQALRADCTATDSARPLGAPPSAVWRALKAEAAWVDRQRIRIPAALEGLAGVDRWVLAHGDGLALELARGLPLPASVKSWGLQRPQDAGRASMIPAGPNAGPASAPWERTPAWRATSAIDGSSVLALEGTPGADFLRRLHVGAQALVALDAAGRVLTATRLQAAHALDDLHAAAEQADDLGIRVGAAGTRWTLWAPTARAVWVCVHDARGRLQEVLRAAQSEADRASGLWRAQVGPDLRGGLYTYLVEVFVPSAGWVRNRVTDPYSISLSADSRHSYIGSLDDPALMPPGWAQHPRPSAPASAVDMMITELHVRDFSASDPSVPARHRGKYRAFTLPNTLGMRHLTEMAQAGLTDVHLLPIFDLATVPERGCRSPDAQALRAAAADSERQQALVQSLASRDCFNWGYDPFHFNAPEGSYASDAQDPAVRIRELRAMVMALHRAGLRVGMDVVYNHMSASGQAPHSVLDRIVPGYYHRLDARGQVERSTCCDNTATEHRMMRKLMIDSAVLWARDHAIDSFRFDLMGHQPREAMEALQQAVDRAAGRRIPLIGEGWNFGEIADGARFVQASQLALNGSGIGTFNDRLRDAARGTRHGDDPATTVRRKGWLNGASGSELAQAADLIRAGLSGSLRHYSLALHDGRRVALQDLDYGGQPAGYVEQPQEVVNYVENHDNPTLFDLNAFKMPLHTDAWSRAQAQVLGSALVALSQGVAYWHAGQEILRSKSMDLNSYDSGDWFNRLDWSLQDNGFGAGLPPGQDSRPYWPLMRERLSQPQIKPTAEVIAWSKAAHLDLLRLRATTPLLRLPDAQAIRERLSFPNAGPGQDPSVIVAHLDGRGWPGSPHRAVLLVLNAAAQPAQVKMPTLAQQAFELHPVHRDTRAGDRRIAEQARWLAADGQVSVPPRSAVVFVQTGPAP